MLTLQLKYLKKQLHIKKRPYKPLFIRLKKSAHKIKPFEYLLKAKTLGFETFNFRCSSCEICFLQISTSPSSSVVLSAETQRFAVTDSHPYAFSFFHLLPSEYGSNFKSWRWRQTLNF